MSSENHDFAPGESSVWKIVQLPGVLPALEVIARQRRLGWMGISWETNDLTHEGLIRLSRQRKLPALENRAEFEKAFSTSIQRALVDKYRRKNAKKRGRGWVKQAVEKLLGVAQANGAGDPDLAGVVDDYIRTRPVHAVIVWMTTEFGLTVERIAAILDMKPESVARKLRLARAELRTEIDPNERPE